LCYLNDVIVFGRTQKELLDRLDRVLQRLHEYGLKVKPSKCVLFKTEIKFLGHLVTASGVQPLPDKVAAIQDWPTPRCLRDVRAFYGLIGYYRRFIEGFETIAEPLTRANKERHKVCLVDRGRQSFSDIESFVATGTHLSISLPRSSLHFDTDCSDVAYGSGWPAD